jgi:carbon monoxide dehydrogenase subunit G
MELVGEYIFEGPRDQVWELIRDPEVLASALPGMQSINQVSDGEYEGEMNVRIGPVAGVFAGRVVISEEIPPESFKLSVEGQGAPGFCSGTGQVRLMDQGDDTTLMKYEGQLQIGGRLATVGQRMVETVSKSMTRQGLQSCNDALQARTLAEGQDGEIPYKPPSETGFAAAVAKDVAADVFSPAHQTVWVAVAVAVIALTVGFWLGRIAGVERAPS